MVIQVKSKCVYGNSLVYPICDKAKLFAKLVGRVTLTNNDLFIINELGYEIKFV